MEAPFRNTSILPRLQSERGLKGRSEMGGSSEEAGKGESPHSYTDTYYSEPPEVAAMKDKLRRMTAYHTDDYDLAESDLHSELMLATTQGQYALEQIMAWTMSIAIGIAMGSLGTGFNLCIDALTRVRYDSTTKFVYPGGTWWKPWLVNIAFATLYSLVAGFLGSYFSPQAGGSGISDIRAYLNGVHISNLLSIRTLIAKTFGVSFSIASGMVAGKEGPFIHIGAIVGGGLANLGSESVIRWTGGKVRATLRKRLSNYFRKPIEHRDYVAVGCAAGIGTAFGAPIGGVLFALEQVSSFYSVSMLWHASMAAAIALFVTLVWVGTDKVPETLWAAHFGNPLDFGVKGGVFSSHAVYFYAPWEVLVFSVMGVAGGLMGALITATNELLFKVRRNFVPRTRPFRRMMEVVFYTVLAVTLWHFICYASPCKPKPVFDQTYTIAVDALNISSGNGRFKAREVGTMFEQLWCPEGQYNEYGVLFWTPISNTLARLYANPALQGAPVEHGPGEKRDQNVSTDEVLYSVTAMGLMFMLVFVLMNATYGIGAAAGIFVPTLLCGAAGGRLVGRIVRAAILHNNVRPARFTVSLAAYAVVGSGALLGGVTRMVLSTVVLIIETSGAENLAVPLIISSAIGKIVADFITIGLYNTNMERHAYPFLPEEPEGLEALKLSHQLQVSDVMTPKIVAMPVVIRIRDMVSFLKKNPFNTIPLISPDPGVLREALNAQQQQQFNKQSSLKMSEDTGDREDRFSCASQDNSFNRATGQSFRPWQHPTLPTCTSMPRQRSARHSSHDGEAKGLATATSFGRNSTRTRLLEPQRLGDTLGPRLSQQQQQGGEQQDGSQHQQGPSSHDTPINPSQLHVNVQGPGSAAHPTQTDPHSSSAQRPRNLRRTLSLSPTPSSSQPALQSFGSLRATFNSTKEAALRHLSSLRAEDTTPTGPSDRQTRFTEDRSESRRRTSTNASSLRSREGLVAGGQGGGGFLYPTPQGALRAALAQQRSLAQQREALKQGGRSSRWDGPQGSMRRRQSQDRHSNISARPSESGFPSPTPAAVHIERSSDMSHVHPTAHTTARRSSDSHASLMQAHRVQGSASPVRGHAVGEGVEGAVSPASLTPSVLPNDTAGGLNSQSAHAQAAPDLLRSSSDTSHSSSGVGVQDTAAAPSSNNSGLRQSGHHAGLFPIVSGRIAAQSLSPHQSMINDNSVHEGQEAAAGAPPKFQAVQEEEEEKVSQSSEGSAMDILGVISRSTLLSILQVRQGFYRSLGDAAKHGGSKDQKDSPKMNEALQALNTNTVKPPSSQEEQDKLFQSLSEAELDSCINLRHHMQRVPYTVPANASLARAYRLFRTLGLHHLFVTAGEVPVVGLMTRSDMVPGAPEMAMYHKMEAVLSAEAEAQAEEGSMDQDFVSSDGEKDGHFSTDPNSPSPMNNAHSQPKKLSVMIPSSPTAETKRPLPKTLAAAAQYISQFTRGGIAAASPAYRDAQLAPDGETSAAARARGRGSKKWTGKPERKESSLTAAARQDSTASTPPDVGVAVNGPHRPRHTQSNVLLPPPAVQAEDACLNNPTVNPCLGKSASWGIGQAPETAPNLTERLIQLQNPSEKKHARRASRSRGHLHDSELQGANFNHESNQSMQGVHASSRATTSQGVQPPLPSAFGSQHKSGAGEEGRSRDSQQPVPHPHAPSPSQRQQQHTQQQQPSATLLALPPRTPTHTQHQRRDAHHHVVHVASAHGSRRSSFESRGVHEHVHSSQQNSVLKDEIDLMLGDEEAEAVHALMTDSFEPNLKDEIDALRREDR